MWQDFLYRLYDDDPHYVGARLNIKPQQTEKDTAWTSNMCPKLNLKNTNN